MTIIKRVDAYTTSDEKVFTDAAEAYRHQAQLDLEAKYEDRKLYGIYAGSYVEFDDLIRWLQNNKDYARHLLRHFT